MALRIAEIFASLQGEGIWAGTPSTFVRISGCNLRCRWCDTPYASWEPEGPIRPVESIVEEVQSQGNRHVVVTGGEPMLFTEVVGLCQQLDARGHAITIETAGTVYQDLPCQLMSISPKLGNSTPGRGTGGEWLQRHEKIRLNREPLARLIERYDCQLKFVVDPESSPGDLSEIESLLAELPAVPPDRILLMPEGTDSATLLRREKRLIPECQSRGWRLAPRLHIHWFGHARGT